MSWSNRIMASLDRRATVLETTHGDVQVGREGHGPPVLAIHGGPGGFDQGLAWCRHRRDGGCEVIAPSRPGYLRTPLESGRSPADQADLYAAILDALHIDRAAILGFSSGGASAVHFAARHPDRTTALFLDTAILLPFEPPLSALQRATFETPFFVWLTYQIATHLPKQLTRFTVSGASRELTKAEREQEIAWITSDAGRLKSLQEQSASMAPQRYRSAGWANDQANERHLAPLPFADVTAPTLIARGANDALVPVAHAKHAADNIAGAELIVVESGHHILSLSRNYGPVAQRQRELVPP